MEVHHHAHTKKKMDSLFLGVFNVISCCVLWIFGRKSTGALHRKAQGKTIC